MPRDWSPWLEFVFVWGLYERPTLRQCLAVLREGDMVVDVGAHLGYYTRHFARAVGEGKVLAIEPHPTNARLLRANTAQFPHVEVIQAAATDTTGDALLWEAESSDMHSLIPSDKPPGQVPTGKIRVETVRLDDILQGAHPKLIKMDIEGSEPVALRGLEQTIARAGQIYLAIEFAPNLLRAAGHEPTELLHLLRAQGFRIRSLSRPPSQSEEIPPDVAWQNLWCEKGLA